jgi:hypothetical protein
MARGKRASTAARERAPSLLGQLAQATPASRSRALSLLQGRPPSPASPRPGSSARRATATHATILPSAVLELDHPVMAGPARAVGARAAWPPPPLPVRRAAEQVPLGPASSRGGRASRTCKRVPSDGRAEELARIAAAPAAQRGRAQRATARAQSATARRNQRAALLADAPRQQSHLVRGVVDRQRDQPRRG